MSDVKVVIDGKEMTVEEAERLYAELHKIFGGKNALPVMPWKEDQVPLVKPIQPLPFDPYDEQIPYQEWEITNHPIVSAPERILLCS